MRSLRVGADGDEDERDGEQTAGHDARFAARPDGPPLVSSPMAGSLTWLGHAAFRIDSPGGKRIYVDPFLTGNPKTPASERIPERVDVIGVTHGHGDHVGDTVELAQKHSCPVVGQVELVGWLSSQGVADARDPNKGGTVDVDGITFTLTNAFHSSSTNDGSYAGEACGIVVGLEDGTAVYFAGDTCVFGDMQLIGRIYKPHVAVLPIGGHYTMDPKEAAVALELLGTKRCVPCHYGTFPALTGTPQQLKQLAPGVDVAEIEPGDSVEL
jgi:L-ascorbate metabolism protein UlaG (beta-lactamase superfamily)